jgi:hypothetical protein
VQVFTIGSDKLYRLGGGGEGAKNMKQGILKVKVTTINKGVNMVLHAATIVVPTDRAIGPVTN